MSGLAEPLPSASLEHPGKTSLYSSGNVSGRSSTYGQAEEATIYTETRMLQDQTGRLRKFAHLIIGFVVLTCKSISGTRLLSLSYN